MLYLCDPRKNTSCKKTGCHYNPNSPFRTCFLCHRAEYALRFWDGRPASLDKFDVLSGRMVGGSVLLSAAMATAARQNNGDYTELRRQAPEIVQWMAEHTKPAKEDADHG